MKYNGRGFAAVVVVVRAGCYGGNEEREKETRVDVYSWRTLSVRREWFGGWERLCWRLASSEWH
jgi:hypothetical protein